MKIGFAELIVVFVVALLVIGPDKLPYYAKKLGAGLQEFRKATKDVTDELRENVVDPLNEAQQPLREALEPLEEIDRDVRGTVKDMQKSFRDIGKTPKAKTAAAGEDGESAADKGEAGADGKTDAEKPEDSSPAEAAGSEDSSADVVEANPVPEDAFDEEDLA